ncbi:MAG: hypothetical protein H6657_15955 [Ardenticatenaceae bacterium]|nr:hypothetical protein [Anaerolineales bacterium]MCB8978910.1 hypothetical protein [Ardenticatenaceae bacterium]
MSSRKRISKKPIQKTALWIQIIATVGIVLVAIIGAWQAIRVAQIGKETPLPVATATPPSIVANPSTPTLVQRIDFDYQDSPIKHGWVMVEGKDEADEEKLLIKHIFDQFVGSAISITSPIQYGMEYNVGLATTQFGRMVEFVADFEEGGVIYAYVSLERDDGSNTTGWIKLRVGKGQPTLIDQNEWQLFIEPVSMIGGEWLLFRVDLEDAVLQTFGTDEWKFQGLHKFRIRGDLSLDYISISN